MYEATAQVGSREKRDVQSHRRAAQRACRVAGYCVRWLLDVLCKIWRGTEGAMSWASRTPKLSRKLSSSCMTQGNSHLLLLREKRGETVGNVVAATVRWLLPAKHSIQLHEGLPQSHRRGQVLTWAEPAPRAGCGCCMSWVASAAARPGYITGRPLQRRGDARCSVPDLPSARHADVMMFRACHAFKNHGTLLETVHVHLSQDCVTFLRS